MQITGDPYTEHVLSALPKDVRNSFSEQQVKALRTALSQVNSSERHLLDVRLSIPLFFSRFYLVFLFDRDNRSRVQRMLSRRRLEGNRVAMVGLFTLFAGLLLLGLLALTFAGVYMLKSTLGIDIFPDQHLQDIFMAR